MYRLNELDILPIICYSFYFSFHSLAVLCLDKFDIAVQSVIFSVTKFLCVFAIALHNLYLSQYYKEYNKSYYITFLLFY